MGFNLKRRVPTYHLCSTAKLTEKRIKESRDPDTNKSIVTIVDADLSQDVLPDYNSFPLEAQIASGVPLNLVNPTILSDAPQNVDKLVESIITDTDIPSSDTSENK